MKTPSNEHIRRIAEKIIEENDDVPPRAATPPMVVRVLNTSYVDVGSLSDYEYNSVFRRTRSKLRSMFRRERRSIDQ